MPPKKSAVIADLIDIPTQDVWDILPPYTQYHLDFTKNIHGIIHLNITALYEAINASSDVAHVSKLKADLAKQIKSQSQLIQVLSRINQALYPEYSLRRPCQIPDGTVKHPRLTAEVKYKMSLQKKMQGVKSESFAADSERDLPDITVISPTHDLLHSSQSIKRKEQTQSGPSSKRTRTSSFAKSIRSRLHRPLR